MRIIGGYQNTKLNKEDFALTPYLFTVYVKGKIIQIYGLGICWGFYSVYIGIAFNLPKKYPSFTALQLKNCS